MVLWGEARTERCDVSRFEIIVVYVLPNKSVYISIQVHMCTCAVYVTMYNRMHVKRCI